MVGLMYDPYKNIQQSNAVTTAPKMANPNSALASSATNAMPATRNIAAETRTPTNEDLDVGAQVAKITSQGSPLIKQAEQRGFQNANRRGLLNSSIAANSAQSAVLDAAVPIASQTAGQNSDLLRTQLGNETQLQVSNLDAQVRRDLAAQDDSRQRDIAALDANTRVSLAGLEDTRQRDINNLQLGQQEKQNAAATIKGISDAYVSAFQAITNNNEIPAATREKYLTHILNITNNQYKLAESLYGVQIQYGGSVAGTPTSTVATGGLVGDPTPAAGTSTTGGASTSAVTKLTNLNSQISTLNSIYPAQVATASQRTPQWSAGRAQITALTDEAEALRRAIARGEV